MAKTKREKTEALVDEILDIDGQEDLISAITKDIRKDFELAEPLETCNEFLSSGNLGVNYILSGKANGGFPVGLITEVAGENSTGKTLLALHALVETQKRGGIPILIDVERSFNHVWFKKLGGNPKGLVLKQVDTMEEVFDFLERVVIPMRQRKDVGDKQITVVWDSLAATSTKYEMENEMEKAEMAMRARVSGKGFRKVMGPLHKAKITFVVINQVRATMAMYGPEVDTVGGKAMKYVATVRLMAKKGKFIEKEKKKIGVSGRFQAIKNRLTAPFKEAQVDIFYDGGINPISGFFNVLKEENVVVNPVNPESEKAVAGWYVWSDGTQKYEDKWREGDFLAQLALRKDFLPEGFKLDEVGDQDYTISDSEASSNVDDDE